MNLAIKDVKDLLVTEELVYFLGDNPQNPNGLGYACSLEAEPTSPVKCVTLYTLPGYVAAKSFSSMIIPNLQFQIRIRCTSITDGYSVIEDISQYLSGLGKTTPSGQTYRYEGFTQIDNINYIGENKDLKAFLYTTTFSTIRNIT